MDKLQEMLERSGAAAGPLAANSRYRGVGQGTLERGGETVPFLRRRFLPPIDAQGELAEHVVAEGERLDAIAHQAVGDPEAFWRVAEANLVLRAGELVERPGATVHVPGGGRLG